jgi:hypothetical protein
MRTLLSIALLVSCSAFAAEVKLGKPLTLDKVTSIDAIVTSPASYVGKTVQVKGKVVEVCQMMGCWMNISDPATKAMIRIKVKDGEIVFPKDAPGKTAVAEGKLVKLELTREQAVAQAKHEAQENGRTFDEKSITAGKTIYQIQGSGAVLMD